MESMQTEFNCTTELNQTGKSENTSNTDNNT